MSPTLKFEIEAVRGLGPHKTTLEYVQSGVTPISKAEVHDIVGIALTFTPDGSGGLMRHQQVDFIVRSGDGYTIRRTRLISPERITAGSVALVHLLDDDNINVLGFQDHLGVDPEVPEHKQQRVIVLNRGVAILRNLPDFTEVRSKEPGALKAALPHRIATVLPTGLSKHDEIGVLQDLSVFLSGIMTRRNLFDFSFSGDETAADIEISVRAPRAHN